MIGFVIGRILWTEAALLLLPALAALLYGESAMPFLGPILLLLIAGLPFRKKPKQTSLYARDGFAVVALAWVLKDPVVTTALIGASRPSQIRDCLKALDSAPFTPEELSLIDADADR